MQAGHVARQIQLNRTARIAGESFGCPSLEPDRPPAQGQRPLLAAALLLSGLVAGLAFFVGG
jgi:hypothetical protein